MLCCAAGRLFRARITRVQLLARQLLVRHRHRTGVVAEPSRSSNHSTSHTHTHAHTHTHTHRSVLKA